MYEFHPRSKWMTSEVTSPGCPRRSNNFVGPRGGARALLRQNASIAPPFALLPYPPLESNHSTSPVHHVLVVAPHSLPSIGSCRSFVAPLCHQLSPRHQSLRVVGNSSPLHASSIQSRRGKPCRCAIAEQSLTLTLFPFLLLQRFQKFVPVEAYPLICAVIFMTTFGVTFMYKAFLAIPGDVSDRWTRPATLHLHCAALSKCFSC